MKRGCHLDHLLVGAKALESCLAWADRELGVAANPAGHHPGRGTENALLGLGEACYLELIASSETAGGESRASQLLAEIDVPQFCWWAVSSDDLELTRSQLLDIGVPCGAITRGERHTASGERLQWRLCYSQCEELGALLPFVIEWGLAGSHPARSLGKQVRLDAIELGAPAPQKLETALAAMGLRENRLHLTEAPDRRMAVTLRSGGHKALLANPAPPAVA